MPEINYGHVPSIVEFNFWSLRKRGMSIAKAFSAFFFRTVFEKCKPPPQNLGKFFLAAQK
jgi:hypothetical protein